MYICVCVYVCVCVCVYVHHTVFIQEFTYFIEQDRF